MSQPSTVAELLLFLRDGPPKLLHPFAKPYFLVVYQLLHVVAGQADLQDLLEWNSWSKMGRDVAVKFSIFSVPKDKPVLRVEHTHGLRQHLDHRPKADIGLARSRQVPVAFRFDIKRRHYPRSHLPSRGLDPRQCLVTACIGYTVLQDLWRQRPVKEKSLGRQT